MSQANHEGFQLSIGIDDARARSFIYQKAGHNRGMGLKPRLVIIHNMIFVGFIGPNREGPRSPSIRILPVPIGSFYFLRFHHPVPATDEVLTFIVKTDPLENGTPCRVLRRPPLFHRFMTVGARRTFLIVHVRRLNDRCFSLCYFTTN